MNLVDGRKIRNKREEWGLSIEELADKLGITRQNLSRIELGTRQPSVALLARIADHFCTPMEELIRKDNTN